MKKLKHKLLALIVLLLISPTMVMAHPGHGTFDGIHFMHYFTSPLHYIVLAGVAVASVFVFRKLRTSKKYN